MAAPRLTPSLAALRDGFDRLAPNRDTASDGWIGDAAHRARVSGHNPDDTAGSLAEYTDPDSIPEVRALDVDVDLHGPVTMQAALDRIIATPADRRRLRYVIFNRRIASASSDWRWRDYNGADPHTGHAHFSGNPDTDDDDRPWSVATMGDDDMTPEQDRKLNAIFTAMFYGGSSCGPTVPAAYRVAGDQSNGNAVVDQLAHVRALAGSAVQGLSSLGVAVDQVDDTIVERLGGTLDPAELADVLANAGVDLDALAAAIAARAGGTQARADRIDVSSYQDVADGREVTMEGRAPQG